MPQKTWVVGEEVLAADFNTYLQQQVAARFATVAARDAAWPAATAGPGAISITTDTSTMWMVIGVAWVPVIRSSRVGGDWGRAANLACVNGGNTPIVWDTEALDTNNFIPANSQTFTVPTGLAGVYTVTVRASFGAAIAANIAYLSIVTGTATFIFPVEALTGQVAGSFSMPLADGATMIASLYQQSGATRNAVASMSVTRTPTL